MGHLGQPLVDPCSPLLSCSALDESSPKHVCSCQLESLCECLLRVHVCVRLDTDHFSFLMKKKVVRNYGIFHIRVSSCIVNTETYNWNIFKSHTFLAVCLLGVGLEVHNDAIPSKAMTISYTT